MRLDGHPLTETQLRMLTCPPGVDPIGDYIAELAGEWGLAREVFPKMAPVWLEVVWGLKC